MKKVFLIILSSLIFIPTCWASTLLDSNSTGTSNDPVDPIDYHAIGQSFTTPNDGNSYKITSVTFSLESPGGGTSGDSYAKLYVHSGTYGSSSVPGTLLATSDPINTSIFSTGYTTITYTFSGTNQYVMTPNTHYVITFEAPSTSSSASCGNGISTYCQIKNSGSDVHSGNLSRFANGGSWSAVATKDNIFEIYGEINTGGGSVIIDSNLTSTCQITDSIVLCYRPLNIFIDFFLEFLTVIITVLLLIYLFFI